MTRKKQIRVLSLCVFRNAGRILLNQGYDRVKRENFYRPVGGAVEFGESAAEALVREIREELGEEIADLRRLGVLENRFTFEGRPGHEIIFVFDARFLREELYDAPTLPVHESETDTPDSEAVWLRETDAASSLGPVYPEGLLKLLSRSDP